MAASREAAGLQCRRVVARGLVQGVGFRDSCVQGARDRGICGWVRNRSDGSVEAVIQGPPAALDGMCDWLAHHVPGARVEALHVETLSRPCENLRGFERRPTV
jgi:acylphosphatase